MGKSRAIASPWDIPVESLVFAIAQQSPEPNLRLRLRRALEQAYTLGRQDGQKLERGKSVVIAMESPK